MPDAAYPPSLIVSDNNYLLPAINQNEPQYASPDAAYPPSLIVSGNDYLLSAINLSEPQYALHNAAYLPSLIVSDDDYQARVALAGPPRSARSARASTSQPRSPVRVGAHGLAPP